MSGRSRWSDKVTVLDPDKAPAPAADAPADPSPNYAAGQGLYPAAGHAGEKRDAGQRARRAKTDEPDDRADTARQAQAGLAQTKKTAAPSRLRALLLGGIKLIAKTLLPLAVIFGAYSIYQHLKATAPEVRKRARTEHIFPVATVVAKVGTYTPQLRLYGNATSGRQVDIRALVAGQVLETGKGLREGGEVHQGDLLLAIDPFNFRIALQEAEAHASEARARLKEQRASRAADRTSLKYALQRLELSKTDLARAVPLARHGAVSHRTVDDRRNIVIQREQAVEQLQNSIHVWDARIAQQEATIRRMDAGVEQARRRLADTRLVAPFDAYVTGVAAQVGRIVSANDKVATLIDRNWIEVRFTLTDAQYGRIIAADKTLAGRRVKVFWRVGVRPLEYAARIERVGAKISAESGGVEIYARIDKPQQNVPMRPGAFVEVQVPDKTFSGVYRLPGTALFGSSTVYAVQKGRLVARKVRQVGMAGSDILVSGGVRPGDHIVRTRLSTPGEGLKVRDQLKDRKQLKVRDQQP